MADSDVLAYAGPDTAGRRRTSPLALLSLAVALLSPGLIPASLYFGDVIDDLVPRGTALLCVLVFLLSGPLASGFLAAAALRRIAHAPGSLRGHVVIAAAIFIASVAALLSAAFFLWAASH
jgi:hypothetical protein